MNNNGHAELVEASRVLKLEYYFLRQHARCFDKLSMTVTFALKTTLLPTVHTA